MTMLHYVAGGVRAAAGVAVAAVGRVLCVLRQHARRGGGPGLGAAPPRQAEEGVEIPHEPGTVLTADCGPRTL